jgi:hypothetical protein
LLVKLLFYQQGSGNTQSSGKPSFSTSGIRAISSACFLDEILLLFPHCLPVAAKTKSHNLDEELLIEEICWKNVRKKLV